MNLEDLKKAAEILEKMMELRKKLEIEMEKDGDNHCECEIANEIQKDYSEIMCWALGKDFENFSSGEESKDQWSKLHPTLPFPRIFITKHINPKLSTLVLLLDIIPLYNEFKNSKS